MPEELTRLPFENANLPGFWLTLGTPPVRGGPHPGGGDPAYRTIVSTFSFLILSRCSLHLLGFLNKPDQLIH